MNRGETTIGALVATTTGICSLIGAIIAPTIYVGGIKEHNSVQDVRISGLEAAVGEIAELRKDTSQIKTDIAVMKKAMELYSPNVGLNFKLAEKLASTTQ